MSGAGFREYVGLTVVSADAGRAQLRLEADDRHLNVNGTVHGGALATLADAAMGTAVASVEEGDERPVTIEMKITYLEPGRPGILTAHARTRRPGRRITIVEVEITQPGEGNGDAGGAAGERDVAHAIATFTTVG